MGNCLNDGFLKAKNNEKIKFYIMWANHDVNYTRDKRNAYEVNRDYEQIIPDIEEEWELIKNKHKIPYFPHVSVGWDNNPRIIKFVDYLTTNNTPENIEKALRKVKAFADATDVSLITINSWNEWTESSYLQPDIYTATDIRRLSKGVQRKLKHT